MCGIFGYVGHDRNAADLVVRGLKKVECRGSDSWGVAVGHRDQVVLEKRPGKIGDAVPDLPASAIGIGHTRWATHGGVTEHNAHPHLDCAGRLALIHNGIVSNYRELREPLVRSGHRFRSETDTEVVAHLIEECLAATPAGPEQLVTATMTAFRRLRGLNAIAVADVRTRQIAAAKSGSPLVLGWSDHGHLLASDFSALLEHTRRVTFVEDRQAVLLSRERCRVFDADTGRELTPAITEVEWEAAATELSGYPDYMTKEVHEQPAVLRRLAEAGGEHARRLAAMIRDAADGFVVGCGTAGHAALAAQYLLARIAGRRVTVATGSEFPYLGDFVKEGALVIALSQSGETIDVIDAVRAARQRGARIAAVVNVEGSTLWRPGGLTVALGGGPARCVLATQTVRSELARLLLTAYELAGRAESYDEIMAGAMQVKARGAMLIGVSPEPHEAFDYHAPVAALGPATAIVNAPPAQLLGYYLALLRGHDPDKPRNLAKSVTVK